MKNKKQLWRLTIFYPTATLPVKEGWDWKTTNETMETFAAGSTKKQTLANWFFQYYRGQVPQNPRIPKDAVSIKWEKINR